MKSKHSKVFPHRGFISLASKKAKVSFINKQDEKERGKNKVVLHGNQLHREDSGTTVLSQQQILHRYLTVRVTS